MTPPPQIQPR